MACDLGAFTWVALAAGVGATLAGCWLGVQSPRVGRARRILIDWAFGAQDWRQRMELLDRRGLTFNDLMWAWNPGRRVDQARAEYEASQTQMRH